LYDDDDWHDVKTGYGSRFSDDADFAQAFEDIEKFLSKGRGPANTGDTADWGNVHGAPQKKQAVPETLGPDFAELGLEFGAGFERCKSAYKRLLKVHHPDRHASHESNMEKATAKSAKINAAYERIRKWYETGQV
ncbi:MAG: J domain-containing protein, partial [Spirochaetaceae bacterium]|nr:J domain-containing protein [Spirochaetaceae bacterium]